jgi:hypothetical protein
MVWYVEKLRKFMGRNPILYTPLKARIKLKFAVILDKFGYCWADLVIWGLGYMDWEDVSKKGCCDNQAYYYCEHCKVNG